MNILVKAVQRCKHCDVDAYYTLSIEDFNSDDISVIELCLKCAKKELTKIIDDFPSVKAFKMEPASLSCQ
jgi:5S rRNA maturation endonuclease (ribonuclease M5)